MKRAVVALSLALFGASCAPKEPAKGAATAAAPTPAAIREADDLVPADLDLVLRIDVERMRRTFGADAFARAAAAGEGGDERSRILGAFFAHATTIFVGLRGASPAERNDAVFAARGDFAELDLGSLGGGFGPPASVRQGIVVFDRTSPTRGGAARVIVLGHRGIVAVTAAEVDAVERILRDGPDRDRLEPPADGVLGVAARVRGAGGDLAHAYPNLARLIGDVRTVTGTLDADGGMLRVDAKIAFRTSDDAQRGFLALETFRTSLADHGTGFARALAEAAKVERAGSDEVLVRVRARGDSVRGAMP